MQISTKLFNNVMILTIISFFIEQKFCKHFNGAENNKLKRQDN